MTFEEFYPLPEAERRTTVLARPLGEAALHEKMAPNPAEFQRGLLLLDMLSSDEYNSRALSKIADCPPAAIKPSIARVAEAYQARTIPHAVATLIENRILPIDKYDMRTYMPPLNREMVRLAARGSNNTEIGQEIEKSPVEVAALWEKSYAGLRLPDDANPSMAVRRSYELGQLRLPPESPVVVFHTDQYLSPLNPVEQATLNGYRYGIPREDIIASGVTEAQHAGARARLLRKYKAMSVQEVVTKACIAENDFQSVLYQEQSPPLTAEHTKILAGIALGYDWIQTARRLGMGKDTLKQKLARNLYPALKAHTQGHAIQRAFETGLFVVGKSPELAATQE